MKRTLWIALWLAASTAWAQEPAGLDWTTPYAAALEKARAAAKPVCILFYGEP